MRTAIYGALGGVCALFAIGFLAAPSTPPVPFTTILGAAAPNDSGSRSPGLAMDLVFSGDGSRVLARQENGEVVAWGLGSGAPHHMARTSGPFAYCAADELLLTSAGGGVTLTSLRDGQSRTLGRAPATHAAISEDCATLAVAHAEDTRISVWRLKPGLSFLSPETQKPVRNGLAISPDGARLAASTGDNAEGSGHDAGVETFALPPFGPAAAGVAIGGEMTLGMWHTVFSPGGALLYAGAQAGGKAGLRAFATSDGTPVWGYDGFEARWLRGLAVSPDGAILATGDEKGMLRLWDAATGELLYQGDAGRAIQSLAFSPDGSMLAVGLWDTTIGVAGVWGLISLGG